MDLHDIARHLGRAARGNAEVTGVTHDSRLVRPGDIYVAVPGLVHHGIEFSQQALDAGAVAIASDAVGISALAEDIPAITLESVRQEMGLLAAHVFGHPEEKLNIVGITGTNGKTTTAFMVAHILSSADDYVGVIGTLGIRIGRQEIPSSRTTPESTDLYRTFAQMLESGARSVVMEVSSHALELHRVSGVHFAVGAFTNLTQDHLDFHGTMENYFAAKSKLFELCDIAVINSSDPWGAQLVKFTTAQKIVSVGATGDYSIAHVQQSLEHGITFTLQTSDDEFAVTVPMLGDFNAMNAAIAIAICAQLGVKVNEAIASLAKFAGVPGRCERVSAHVPAIVDYAHTPDAVEKVLESIRTAKPSKVITVLGCGGDRDPSKRQSMGQAAGQLSDVVIVTDDNPRSEAPESIRAQVMIGANQTGASVIEIGQRREAIRYALEHASPHDVVVVLGKGHEVGQEIAGVVYPFDDREVIRQESLNA